MRYKKPKKSKKTKDPVARVYKTKNAEVKRELNFIPPLRKKKRSRLA